MFDLEREVAAWSEAVYAGRCSAAASVAEISDHLYCEIDRARAEGLTDEAAFRAAIARLGSAAELTAENAKNRPALAAVCRVAARIDRPVAKPEHRRLLIAHAMIWAALIVGASLMMRRTVPDLIALMLIVIFVPLWWSSEQLLRSALRMGATR